MENFHFKLKRGRLKITRGEFLEVVAAHVEQFQALQQFDCRW